MSESIDEVVALAVEAGAVSDGSHPVTAKETVAPAETKPARYVPPYEKKHGDPYTDPWVRETAEGEFGVLIMEDRHAKGLCTAEELEAVKFFAGSVADQLGRITDAARALEVLKVYGERGIVPEKELESHARKIAEKEIERHKQESARNDEAARLEREESERVAQALARKATIEESVYAAYQNAHRELLGPPEF